MVGPFSLDRAGNRSVYPVEQGHSALINKDMQEAAYEGIIGGYGGWHIQDVVVAALRS